MRKTIQTGILVSLITIALMAGMALWASLKLPADNIPVHWGIDGTPDRYGGRAEALFGLWVVPISAFFSALVFALLPALEPMRDNLIKSRRAYRAIWISTMVLMFGIHAGLVWLMVSGLDGVQNSNEFVRFVIAGTGLLFLLIGNYLPKTRQNWFLGIRTPWTLSSEFAWEKTHRLAGRLFMAAGFIAMIGAFVVNGIWLVAMITSLSVGSALISIVYSYFAWRSAPDKRVSPDYVI